MSEEITSTSVVVPERGRALEFEIVRPTGQRKVGLTTRPLSLIPYMLATCVWVPAALAASVVAWFAILFTGQYPSGLFDFNARAWRFLVYANSYGMLLVDDRPGYSGAPAPEFPVRADVTRLPEYNRLLTGFRFFLLIPLYVVFLFVIIAAYAAAVPSIVTLRLFRRQPASLYRVIAFAMRLDAYLISSIFLLTEIIWIPS